MWLVDHTNGHVMASDQLSLDPSHEVLVPLQIIMQTHKVM